MTIPPKLGSQTQAIVERLFPGSAGVRTAALVEIWDQVVDHITEKMFALPKDDEVQLHINVREEMVEELVRLRLWLAEQVVSDRTLNRDVQAIDIELEREACLGPVGMAKADETAKMVHEHIWLKRMRDRWEPKSVKAIEREANPKPAKLAVKRVDKNHYIPRWFIRDYWSTDARIRRWRRGAAAWSPDWAGFGEWGYRYNLYSDQLEAYFGLLEGDAKLPIQMLIDRRPLNQPQRKALVGFLTIQVLRNPHFAANVNSSVMALGLTSDPDLLRRSYETLFRNNDLYSQLATPVMASPWALVRSEKPVFVLPDTFGARVRGADGVRVIVPLKPDLCFVTLPGSEEQKRIVPFRITADDAISTRISRALVSSSVSEFISHPGFERPSGSEEPVANILTDLATLTPEE